MSKSDSQLILIICSNFCISTLILVIWNHYTLLSLEAARQTSAVRGGKEHVSLVFSHLQLDCKSLH